MDRGVLTVELNLQQIDTLRDRTGCSYAEAREALVATDGDVVEALVHLEARKGAQASDAGGATNDGAAREVLDKVKELWTKGADTKIRIVRDDETIFDMPLTAGLVGALLAPQAAFAGALVAYASRCSIAITKPGDTHKSHSTTDAAPADSSEDNVH
jgi:hypothetical protein